MQKAQGWTDESVNYLKRLVSNNDQVITGAFECFKLTQNMEDLAETLNLSIQAAKPK